MKRSRTPVSSLELFLDTIANTFGGIVFLAILLSVLVQMRTKTPQRDKDSKPQMSRGEYRELVLELEDLEAEHAMLSESIGAIRKAIPSFSDEQLEDKQAAIQKLEQDLEERLKEQAEAAKRLAKKLEENSDILQELDSLESQLQLADQGLEKQKAEFEQQLTEHLQVFKPPKVQVSFKQSVIIMFRGGRIFPVYEAMSSRPYAAHVRTQRISAGLRVDLLPGGGWRLTDPVDSQALIDYLRAHPNNRYFVSIGIWSDSFGAFEDLKMMLIDIGMEYQIQPFEDDAQVLITEATELPQVQ